MFFENYEDGINRTIKNFKERKLQEQINKEQLKCLNPECRSKNLHIGGVHRTWYGKQYEYLPNKSEASWSFFTPIKYLGEKNQHWEIKTVICSDCGFSWELPANRW